MLQTGRLRKEQSTTGVDDSRLHRRPARYRRALTAFSKSQLQSSNLVLVYGQIRIVRYDRLISNRRDGHNRCFPWSHMAQNTPAFYCLMTILTARRCTSLLPSLHRGHDLSNVCYGAVEGRAYVTVNCSDSAGLSKTLEQILVAGAVESRSFSEPDPRV